jgi:hypothetical protein
MVAPLLTQSPSTQRPVTFNEIKNHFKDPGYFAKDHSIRLSGNELKLHGAFSLSGRGETKAAARLVKQEAGKTAIAAAISYQYQGHPGLGARVMQNLNDKNGGSFKLTPAKLGEVQREIEKELSTAKTTSMPRTEAPAAIKKTVNEEVESFFLKPSKDVPMKLDGGRFAGVSKAFWLDLSRADFSIAGHNGASTVLIDKSTLTSTTKDAACTHAVARLRDLCGGNADLLMAVSRLANQNMGAVFQIALSKPESPLHLPNGTPGSFSSSIDRGTSHFAFSSDGNGSVKISVTFSQPNCNNFFSSNGERTELDPAGSRYDSFLEINVGPDLKPTVSVPPAFSFDVRLAA